MMLKDNGSSVADEKVSETADEMQEPASEDIKNESPEKRVPVSEAIRYRKRAQAAEKELDALKASHQEQADELATVKAQLETIQAGDIDHQSQYQSGGVKTQGVKELQTTGSRSRLQNAAKQAAGSGSRADVQEYLRIRRSFL